MLTLIGLWSQSLKSEFGIMRKMFGVTASTGREVHKKIMGFLGTTNRGPPTFRASKLGEGTAKLRPHHSHTEQRHDNMEYNPTKDQPPKAGLSSIGPRTPLRSEAVPTLVGLPGAVHISRRLFPYPAPISVPQGYNHYLPKDWLRHSRDPCSRGLGCRPLQNTALGELPKAMLHCTKVRPTLFELP